MLRKTYFISVSIFISVILYSCSSGDDAGQNNGSNTTQIIGKFCGQVNPPKMLSSSNEVLIHFETFQHYQMDGFKLEYQPSSKLPFPKKIF